MSKELMTKTYYLEKDIVRRLENYAYTERLKISTAINDILKEFLDDYEQHNEILEKPEN